ncbi:hypothetical protein O0235_01555 [Tepidiforma flava]|uniref:Fe/B12 periplasmic-binding domain-containing protein n=1 Tax=Tepidiforma flava TaxID=3004094 RepID=A0ABY7M727_9CHLR|nr:hypothetical protein [Tepidiforma flava]WBL36299.1 hypothetical protein O0235_01555 [Tepidiforma flava]
MAEAAHSLALSALALAALAGRAAATMTTRGDPPPAATAAAATPTESPAKRVRERLQGVPGIVDPANLSWPREVEGLNGKRTIKAKPSKIHTMSAGIDEITLSLVPLERVVAVGSATKNPDTTSFAPLVQNLPTAVREPEAVIATGAELVIATPTQKADVVAAMESAGVTVVQLNLDPTPAGRLNAILLLGYIYGEEERAIALADEVRRATKRSSASRAKRARRRSRSSRA